MEDPTPGGVIGGVIGCRARRTARASTAAEDDEQALLAQRLLDGRRSARLSQEDVAAKTGVPRTAISDIEHGRRRVNAFELRDLARAYLLPVSHFLDDHDPADPAGGTVRNLERLYASLPRDDQRVVLVYAEFLQYQAAHRHHQAGLPRQAGASHSVP